MDKKLTSSELLHIAELAKLELFFKIFKLLLGFFDNVSDSLP